MPDSTLDAPEREQSERLVPRDRQPINNELPYHPYQESEFPNGKGHCGSCGGGPDALIHQKPIDSAEQLKRIADALENIAGYLSELSSVAYSIVDSSDDGRGVNTRERA